MKRALILGVGGQDGSYLAHLLLARGYDVHGLHRHSSVDNLGRIAHLRDLVTLHRGDLTDERSLRKALYGSDPDEVYNMADQDNVDWSFSLPEVSVDVTYWGVVRLLGVVQDYCSKMRVFQPVSATMFGDAQPPQDEDTPLCPLSPYACAKAAAWHYCRYMRRVHGLKVSCGIMYNHDSPRRGEEYLLQKVCKAAAQARLGMRPKFPKCDLTANVDIGFAGDFVDAAWRMLQLEEPGDFVVASGRSVDLDTLFRMAFGEDPWHPARSDVVDGRVEWVGEFKRPGPVHQLMGDASKLRAATGWRPTVCIEELTGMVTEEWERRLR